MSENTVYRNHDISNAIEQIKNQFDFLEAEITAIQRPLTIDFYKKWLSDGSYGGMKYLFDHLEIKENPKLLNKNFNSVISVSASYLKPSSINAERIPARTALYSQSDDYHIWLKKKLLKAIEFLQKIFPDEIFTPYVDSGPILEREWGHRNKLGWFGKNTCLIHPKHGSLFFIAEIMTSIQIDEKNQLEPLPDFCGTCDRCIKSCPTQAIKSPHYLKADECISYLTIEAKTPPPMELRNKIGDWFFGCDICQTVCPWNEKIFKKNQLQEPIYSSQIPLEMSPTERKSIVGYFTFLFTNSNRSIYRKHADSPLLRAGPRGLRRNALIVSANRKLVEMIPIIERFVDPRLDELKNWALQELKSN
jgi:epoxyqueuosine reductase